MKRSQGHLVLFSFCLARCAAGAAPPGEIESPNPPQLPSSPSQTRGTTFEPVRSEPLSIRHATHRLGGLDYATGFEPEEGFMARDLGFPPSGFSGWIHGQPANPDPSLNWMVLTQGSSEPHISTVHPYAGGQHLRLGVGQSYAQFPSSEFVVPQPMAPFSISMEIAIRPLIEIAHTIFINQPSRYLTSTAFSFDRDGFIYVAGCSTNGGCFTYRQNTGFQWDASGQYRNLTINFDPCNSDLEYYYDGVLIYQNLSEPLVGMAVEQILISGDPRETGYFDLDDLIVTRGEPCDSGCGNFELEPELGEECDGPDAAACPGDCRPNCTCGSPVGACCDANGYDLGCTNGIPRADCRDIEDTWYQETNCADVECACVPDCEGRTCGDDGCGGLCGHICDHEHTYILVTPVNPPGIVPPYPPGVELEGQLIKVPNPNVKIWLDFHVRNWDLDGDGLPKAHLVSTRTNLPGGEGYPFQGDFLYQPCASTSDCRAAVSGLTTACSLGEPILCRDGICGGIWGATFIDRCRPDSFLGTFPGGCGIGGDDFSIGCFLDGWLGRTDDGTSYYLGTFVIDPYAWDEGLHVIRLLEAHSLLTGYFASGPAALVPFDLAHTLIFIGDDCNDNLNLDESDISSGASADADGDGTPDECETDCQPNGLPDDHELNTGAATDCNANQIPDECEAAGCNQPQCGDCNANAALDECDIASGLARDIDGAGVPDECEGLIPVASSWGLTVLALLLLITAKVGFRRPIDQPC